jgi:alpha-N-arabinofuranosidase
MPFCRHPRVPALTAAILAAIIAVAAPAFAQSGVSLPERPEGFHNPIIPGFHPDPSICRVGKDYYLVNSSFGWFPGVPIFHSRDLVNWRQIGNVLDRPSQLELAPGSGLSAGIYAPTIRHHDGTFYLICTVVGGVGNFFVTASDPAGPWSEPTLIKEAGGFDPSLFFDDDGSTWYVGTDPKADGKPVAFSGESKVFLQRIDLATGALVGERTILTNGFGKNAVWAEGPHIFKIDGKYLLIASEGGTSTNHAICIYTADKVDGPYAPVPQNPMLTHRNLGPDVLITSIGHGDLVQTQNGEWWCAMLGVRELPGPDEKRFHILGRETFLTPVRFSGGIPYFNPGKGRVLEFERLPDLPWSPQPEAPVRDGFDGGTLGFEWVVPRTPRNQWWSLTDRSGWLTMQLRPERPTETSQPSMTVRRQEHLQFEAVARIDFAPATANETAGLIILQNEAWQLRVEIAKDGEARVARLVKVEKGKENVVATAPAPDEPVCLGVRGDGLKYQFLIGPDKDRLAPLGPPQDGTILSTQRAGGFIGTLVGLFATSQGESSATAAAFDWFDYQPLKP